MFDDSTRKQKQWLDTTIYICIHILVNNGYAIGYVGLHQLLGGVKHCLKHIPPMKWDYDLK